MMSLPVALPTLAAVVLIIGARVIGTLTARDPRRHRAPRTKQQPAQSGVPVDPRIPWRYDR